MKLTRLLLTFALLTLAACGSNGGVNVVEKTAQAMGGSAALQAVQSQQIVATGTWFEPEQTFQPADAPRQVSTFTSSLTTDLANDRLRYAWSRAISYPSVTAQSYTEVVDRDQGLVTGNDGSGPTPAAMPSVRVATVRKLNRLTSPLALLRTALADPTGVEVRPDEFFEGQTCHVLALTGEQPRPIRLFISPRTFLPVKADTLEDDPYYGDTLYEVLYADWQQQGAILTPMQLTQRLTGLGRTITLQNEVRSQVENNVALDPALFAIPTELRVPADAASTARGERMAQWFLRRQAIGIPSFTDQSLGMVINETRLGSGLFFVSGGTHNSLIIERPDHLIVVEPALYESRSLALIAQIKTRFPGKPIRYVVASHFHIDHAGGVRAFVAEGATVVAGAASQAHFEAILAAPHTVFPDSLQNNPHPAAVVLAVSASEGLPLAGGAVVLYPVADQTHAADMVVPFVPAEGLLFVSDLFSPAGVTVAPAAIPLSLQQTFIRFGLTVTTIAGGHGTLAAVQ
jgi:glyoxylase-like metal-dependent hydrolase (beta-lactamase superfamily II)